MIHTLANGTRICTVDVPELPSTFYEYVLLTLPEHGLSWLHFVDKDGNDVARTIEIHMVGLQLLGRFDEITEETWKGVVDEDEIYHFGNWKIGYRDYNYGYDDNRYYQSLKSATASARSLIPGNPVVLIDNNKQ